MRDDRGKATRRVSNVRHNAIRIWEVSLLLLLPPPSSYEVVESSRVDSLPGRGIAGYVEDAHRLPDALLCRETMVAVARPSRCREIVGTLRTGNIASSYSCVMEYNRNMAGRVRNTTIRVDSISDARETKRKGMFRENVSSLEIEQEEKKSRLESRFDTESRRLNFGRVVENRRLRMRVNFKDFVRRRRRIDWNDKRVTRSFLSRKARCILRRILVIIGEWIAWMMNIFLDDTYSINFQDTSSFKDSLSSLGTLCRRYNTFYM